MTPPTRPTVSDPELRSALERVGSYIENYTSNLDAISNDIKAIEKYLSDSGIRLVASVLVSTTAESGHGGWFQVEEHIEWTPNDVPLDEDDARWRVMYRTTTTPGHFEGENDFVPSGPAETEQKPLIETPIAVRLKLHGHLAELVRRIGKIVEVWPKSLEDIPF